MIRWARVESLLIAMIVILSVSVMTSYLQTSHRYGSMEYTVTQVDIAVVRGGNASVFSDRGFTGYAGTPYEYTTVVFNSDNMIPINITGILVTTPEFFISSVTPGLPQSIPGDSYITISFGVQSTLAVSGYSGNISVVITE